MTLRIGVLGPTGFGGSYLCFELLQRGLAVRGLSRRPEKLGSHEKYTPHPIDIESASLEELIEAFKDLDVLVNEYGPHTAGENALKYRPFLELTRKIVIAAKEAKLRYRRSIADSHAHVSYMEERLGSMGTSLRAYRNARRRLRSDQADEASLKLIEDYETVVMNNDQALEFVTASRTSYMFFDGNTSFKWTYVSPPALYRSGKRTGAYETIIDELPVKPAPKGTDASSLDGRLHGISVADLAIAIADEVENKKLAGKHWSAFADMSDDIPTPSYITI
ncbi:hypothetical protein N0V84_006750 [Fusarium piperis]|uniref:NAD(P)-binding domain-containing protein n=1 Tax=Fusarium piperis TaxID=1435070 RepID=A0A9W8WBB8_9HYPO|nr:hypothetical protein N0V84_006750 [Fusarium piperis]